MAEPTMPEKVWNEKHVTQPFRRCVVGEQGIIRGMIDRVAEPGDAVHGDEDPIIIGDAGDGEGAAAQYESDDQHRARAHAVDDEADGRLQQAGDDIEDGHCQRQLGISYPKIVADERQ